MFESRHLPLFAIAVGASALLACSSAPPSDSPALGGDEDEVVSGAAALECKVEGDPCVYAAPNDLGSCIDAVVLTQMKRGKIRIEIARRAADGSVRKQTASSDEKSSLSGTSVTASWFYGETWVQLEKAGSGYAGEMAIDEDFGFEVKCAPPSPALSCKVGDKTYAVGDTFPSDDGCNTCSCNDFGDGQAYASCTELYCPPQCKVGDKFYLIGESFPAEDGCNTCTCNDYDGQAFASCTELACAKP